METGFAVQDELTQAVDLDGVEDLLEYLDGPQSFGLDGMRSDLRHMILLMMELQGYETGYRSQQMNGLGHTSMIMNGVLASDAKKRMDEQKFWEDFYKFLEQLETHYEFIITHVQKRIDTVQENIVAEVKAIDAQISAVATNEVQGEALKAVNERRTVLKWLLHRLDRHEDDLQNADTAAEAVQLHQKVEQDIKDVEEGNVSVNRSANRPSPLVRISEFVRVPRAPTTPEPIYEYGHAHERHTDSEDSKDSAGSGGKSGKGGRGSSSAGSTSGESSGGAGDKDDLPPPPVSPEGF